jgi:hypothetical protein
LMERLEDIVNAALLRNIPESKLKTFDELLETGSDDDIQGFCHGNIPDVVAIVVSVLAAFRKQYLGIR